MLELERTRGPGEGPETRVSGVHHDRECACVSVSRASSFGMCGEGSGCARTDMKMRSGKVVPLCRINQGGKGSGCERQSLETAGREGRGREGEREVGREERGRREKFPVDCKKGV